MTPTERLGLLQIVDDYERAYDRYRRRWLADGDLEVAERMQRHAELLRHVRRDLARFIDGLPITGPPADKRADTEPLADGEGVQDAMPTDGLLDPSKYGGGW